MTTPEEGRGVKVWGRGGGGAKKDGDENRCGLRKSQVRRSTVTVSNIRMGLKKKHRIFKRQMDI